MKNITKLFLLCCLFLCGFKSIAQTATGDIAIIGYNGNSSPAELAIVTLAAIPSGQTIYITDRGWHSTNGFDVANVSVEGLITWTTNTLIPAGTVIKISITPGVTPVLSGLTSYGTSSATGWGTLVTAGGGDNWFIYTGSVASPTFIYAFANWSTNTPGGTSSPTPWQTSGNVNATTSYLPPLLAAGNYSAAFTGSTLHGDYIIYTGTVEGTKDQILANLSGTGNWTHNETTPVVLTPGGTGFPGTNPIFQLPPSVTQVTSSTLNGTYKIGAVIPVAVTFSSVVTVTGTPTLSLNTGATVNYSSGNGTNTLTFNYTIASGQSTADLDYSATTALSLNGGTIQDASSNNAVLTLVAPGAANSLGNSKAIVIDGVVPTLTSVAIASNNASNQTAKTGNIISLSFTASEAVALPVVTIAGNTALTTSAGGNSYLATYTLTGTETEGTLAFNIAFTDLAGNAGTAVTATTNSSSVTYDKTIPTLSTVTIASNNITTSKAKLGDVITLNFTASEAIATPTVTMGGTAVTPTNSGNNWTATQTVSGLTPEGVLAFNIAFSDLTGNAGTPVTATTNSSSVTVDRTAPAAPTNLAAISGNTENVISWDASPAPDLDKYILYAGTSNNPTTAIQTIPAGTLTYTHTGLTNGTGYFYRISAVDLTGNEGAKSGNIVSVPKAAQTITFNSLAASVYGATPITLTATSSSALTVTYTSSNTAVATVSGSTVTVLTAGTTTITASQAGNSAFLAATPVTQDLVVNKKDIAVAAVVKTKVYGAADPAFTYTFSPALVGLDTFTGNLDRATGENIGNYAIGQGTLALSNNYTLAFTSADLSITAKPVTVTAAAKTKIFTAADPAFTYTVSPALIGTDAFTGSLDRAAGEDVGTYAIGQGNLSLGTNYQITYVPANLTITSKAIAVTAAAKTKVYGDADPALTYTFSPALNGTDVFTGSLDRAAGENIGNYAITQGTLALSNNYALNYTTADLSITKKTVNVTATAGNKEYGTTDPVFAYTFSPALIGTDTFTGTLDRAAGENIGNYAIGQGTLALSNNYTLAFTSADFSITKKTVNVTAIVKTKVYGTADPAFTYTFSPALIGTDVFTGSLNRTAGENIGNYAITQGTLALSNNYTLAFTSADLNITAKPVTVTAAAKTKIFTAADPAFTYTFSPALIGTDAFTGSLDRAAGENIGNYAIGQGNLSLGTNYQITYVPANLTITSKAITVTAAAKTKVYGDADPALTYTFSPALNGTDAFTGSLDRAAGENIGNYAIGQGTLALSNNYALNYTSADLSITKKTVNVAATAGNKEYGTTDPVFAYTFSPALIGTDTFTGTLDRAAGESIGNYAIGQGTLALSNNYTLAFTSADFSITKKTVNITAIAKTKVYGTADPVFTYTFSPALIGTDVFTGGLNRTAGENIGNYAITQGTLALNSNYTLAFTSADLSITPKPVTVTAVAKTKVYGTADPALTYTFSPALIGTDAFTGNLARTSGENIGDYVINQGSLVLNNNYLITYNPANLSITTKALAVTAVTKTKTYGDADPVLTYTFSPALTGTDTFTGSLTRAAGENIGSYAISQGTVTAGTNYLITYTPANLSIGTKTISVTATAAAKTYGAADPALTYTFSPALIGTDAFTGSLNRAPGENTGTYAINQNTLSLSSNYVLNYTAANLSINKAVLTITADNKEKFAGTVNPALTVSYSGFVNSETNAVLTTQPVINTTATTGSPLGTYSIVPSGAAAVNYQISYVNGILTIKPGAPTNVLLAGVTLYENKASGTAAGTLSSTSDDPAATFTYSLVAGTGDTDNTLFSISGNQVLTAAALDYENKATYNVRVRSTTQYGFSLDKTFTISLSDVNEIPTLAAVANQTICYTTATQNISLTGISAGPETTQSTSISVAGNNSALLQSLTVSGSGATGIINYSVKTGASGTATITVTVKDNGGTANGGADTYSRTFVLTVNALPVVSVTADKGKSTGTNRIEVSKGETVFLNATGGATYAWASHSSIVRGLNSATLEVRPRETTTYTVTVTNASGCTESQTFSINVLDDLEKIRATNLVSPNGDGINDKWVVYNIDFYPNNQVKIFDKSGRLIYSKKGYDDSWDATLNGLPLSEGTYYYIIDFGTDRRIFKGYITVTRPEQTR